MFDLRTTWLTLVIQPVKADDVLWSGMPMTKEQALAKYDVDEVLTMDELKSRDDIWLGPVALPDANGFLAEERGLFAKRYAFKDEKGAMLELGGRIAGTIGELRVVKDLYEIALIRKANMISEIAHVAVMKAIGGMKNEREAMALFHQQCTIHAARDQAYDSIVAGGCNAATLHYVHDDQDLAGRELLLVDAGCEVNCYASDITRTYPIRGKWTPNGRALYALVLKMQMDCMSMLRAGVVWEDVHRRAHDVAYDGLIEELKILKKGAPRQLTAAFFPHGLGHYLGLDTHDTGGNADYKDADIMFRYLRVRGSLPANCVITVEPGVSLIQTWSRKGKRIEN